MVKLMTYTSFTFIFFLVGLIAVYFSVPKRFQWVVLLAASYAFYLSNGFKQVFFLIGSTALTYCTTLFIQKLRNDNKKRVAAMGEITKEQKRAFKKQVGAKIKKVQYASIAMHLLLLGAVKYLNTGISYVNSFGNVINKDFALPKVSIIVPLGISFFTFASMGYIIDVARGKYEPERNFFKVATFVSFFPSIVEGPINLYGDVGVQLFKEHKFDYDRLVKGAELMLWGFFKKLVIAERAGLVVNTVFSPSSFTQYTGSQFIFGICIYAAQIYGDFSGGIDIARGAAEILGIDMPLNFERPMFSTSVQEYWKRWHMTLGGWMREYVFYPVMLSKPVRSLSLKAGKRFGKFAGKIVPSTITPFVVFFLMGIWHGAGIQYILYGIYNAVVVSSSVAFDPLFKKIKEKLHINTQAFSYKVFCMFRAFALVSGARLIVKSPSYTGFKFVVKSILTNFNPNFLFGLDGKYFSLGLDAKNMLVLFISVLVLATVSILQENGMHIRETLNKQNLVFRWVLLLALFTAVLIFGHYGPGYDSASFIYQAY